MKSLLHTLQDSESVLLMYLFDELPADDRIEVEAMLATDANLRKRLEHLREVHSDLADALANADEAVEKRASLASTQRNVCKAIDRWHVREVLEAPALPAASRGRRWVLIGSSVAAAIVVTIMGFVYLTDPGKIRPGPMIVDNSDWTPEQDFQLRLAESFEQGIERDPDQLFALAGPMEERDLLRRFLDVSDDLLKDSLKNVHLADAELQVNVLAQLGDPDAISDGLLFQ